MQAIAESELIINSRGAIYHLLRGHVINGLVRQLPPSCHLLLHS